MIRIKNNHICCLQYQTKKLLGRAQLFLTDPRINKNCFFVKETDTFGHIVV